MRLVSLIGGLLVALARNTGEMLFLLAETVFALRDAPRNMGKIVRQCLIVGVQTLPLVALMALFVGMVLAVQTGGVLEQYGSPDMLGALVALALVKELGPVLTGLLVAGRVGSAMAAEIGTMQVYDEVPSLVTLGISPIRFLSMPRLVAALVCLPTLTTFANVIGVFGGALVAGTYLAQPVDLYLLRVQQSLDFEELWESLSKAFWFGMIIATVGCHQGFATRGGAEGVGRATTSSVVIASILIIVCDYFISRFSN